MACKMCEKHKNIKDDPYFIMGLETGYVILGWFQRFKGYTVFNCKEHGPELHNLEHNFKVKHLEEMFMVAEAVYNVLFKPDKMNYELLEKWVSSYSLASVSEGKERYSNRRFCLSAIEC